MIPFGPEDEGRLARRPIAPARMRQNAGMPETSDDEGASKPDAAADPAQTAALAQPGPKRTWRRIVVVIAFLVVAGAAVWWRQTSTSDPKLAFTQFNHVVRVEHDATGNQEGITKKENVTGIQVDVAFVPNQRIYVYLGLINRSGRAVRIEQAPMTGFYYFGFDTMEISPDPNAAPGLVTTFEPFKPFTLKPGETRSVRLTFRLADCSPSNLQPGTTFVKGLVVRYKILGLKRAWLVPFEDSALAVPSIGRCEHPITDSAGGPVQG